MAKAQQKSLLDAALLREAFWGALRKLSPRALWRNPVMLAVELAGAITLVAFALSFLPEWRSHGEPGWFTGMVPFCRFKLTL